MGLAAAVERAFGGMATAPHDTVQKARTRRRKQAGAQRLIQQLPLLEATSHETLL